MQILLLAPLDNCLLFILYNWKCDYLEVVAVKNYYVKWINIPV